jgi:hypothetical protein
MTSGECLIQILSRNYEILDKENNACIDLRKLISLKRYDENGLKIKNNNIGILRQKFATNSLISGVHGPDTAHDFQREIKIFFSKKDLLFAMEIDQVDMIFNHNSNYNKVQLFNFNELRSLSLMN